MSLQLGPALKRGAAQVASRAGAVVLVAYAVTMLVYQLSFNTLLAPLFARVPTALAGESAAPNLVTLPVPGVVAGGLVLVALLVATIVSIVAVRTFVARQRGRIPRRFLHEHMAFAVANVVVGGIVFGVTVLAGTVLLVVPGVLAYVGFLFVMQFVAVENDNFVTAMRRSWRLSKGNRLRILLLVVVVFAAVFVVTFATGFTLGFVLGSGGLTGLAVGMVNVVTTLYLFAVVSDAFVQLREESETAPRETRPTADALGA